MSIWRRNCRNCRRQPRTTAIAQDYRAPRTMPPDRTNWSDTTWSNTMADVTYYVALPFQRDDSRSQALRLPFQRDDSGSPVAGAAEECQSSSGALRRAEVLSKTAGCVGAVAFSRTGDPLIGEFSDAQMLRKFGDVPDDLSGL